MNGVRNSYNMSEVSVSSVSLRRLHSPTEDPPPPSPPPPPPPSSSWLLTKRLITQLASFLLVKVATHNVN